MSAFWDDVDDKQMTHSAEESTTAEERKEWLDEALRRAALLVGARRWQPTESEPRYWEAVEGWATAIRALRQFFDGGDHMTSCNLSVLVGEDYTDVTCSPFCREVRNAVASFIKAMLGTDVVE